MDDRFKHELFRVPWASRRTAHGFASDVPSAILNITSPEAETRRRAYNKLDNGVVLQSDLYEAALDVVPFLVSLLRQNPEYGRAEIYDVLYEIGNGAGNPAGTPDPLRNCCRRAVREGIDVYKLDAAHPDPRVRQTALDLVEGLTEDDNE